MIVGLSMRVTKAETYDENRSSIADEYVSMLEALGHVPLLFPNSRNSCRNILKEVAPSAIILTGGNKVATSERPNPKEGEYPQRDEVESLLVDYAMNQNIPLVGICRGFHFINFKLSGNFPRRVKNHVAVVHSLESSLAFLNQVEVNSFHDWGLLDSDLDRNLEVIAKTSDGVVEAFVHKTQKIIGIQWHPERPSSGPGVELVNYFLSEGRIEGFNSGSR